MSEHEEQKIKGYDSLIRATSVGAEQPPFMAAMSRWEYVSKYMKDWQEAISFALYWKFLAALGLVLLVLGNPLSILAFAGCTYYRIQYDHRHHQVTSGRRVILGN